MNYKRIIAYSIGQSSLLVRIVFCEYALYCRIIITDIIIVAVQTTHIFIHKKYLQVVKVFQA